MEEDLQVHAEGQVSGVFPVIFGLYIDGQLVAAVDLRQAGQAGTNVVGMYFIARIDQVVLVIQRGARAEIWGSSSRLVLRRNAPLLVM